MRLDAFPDIITSGAIGKIATVPDPYREVTLPGDGIIGKKVKEFLLEKTGVS